MRNKPAFVVCFFLFFFVLEACDEDGFPFNETHIAGVEIVANPNNVLSCYVRWHTTNPATTRVEWGLTGEGKQFYVEDSALVLEHEIFVFGLRPESVYYLQAVSVREDGTELRSDDLGFYSGSVPFAEVVTEVTVYEPDLVEPGWTLMNVCQEYTACPTIAVAYDAKGFPVWYYEYGSEDGYADVEVTLVDIASLTGDEPEWRILIGGSVPAGKPVIEVDLEGRIVWEGPIQADYYGADGYNHHMFERIGNGDYAGLYHSHDSEEGVTYTVVREIDPDSEIVWEWNLNDHADMYQGNSFTGNHAVFDFDAGYMYYSDGYEDQLRKVEYPEGDIVWSFGNSSANDFEMGFDGQPWGDKIHAPELIERGDGVETWLFYDNGRTVSGARAVEYRLDEEAMTAEVVWEYPSEDIEDYWYNYEMGDVDRLANGNTLIAAGNLYQSYSQSRIMEVAADGDKVWEMLMYMNPDEDGEERLAGFYMAERIPPLVNEL